MTTFTNDFSKEVYEQTYCYGKETIDDTLNRIAVDMASIEKDKDYWTEKFNYILQDFKFVPGGRIISNAGLKLKSTSYLNCFADGFVGEKQDSMEGILSALRRQALILKSEGGYGFCCDVLRPRGAFINGISNESPGPIRMLDMWDMQSAVITEGSGKKSERIESKKKIRKGAQMVTMSCWNPSIEEFILSKQTPGKLTKFNMSVLVTDEFMRAVKNNEKWDLIFPDYEADIKTYDKEWDGNIKKWQSNGYPIKIYKTFDDANELWDLIMKSTHTRNEPGVLFIDTINKFNNLYYKEYINTTNPCAEQPLPIGGVCLLGSLNLTHFVKDKDWDYDKLTEIIPIVVRFMDNVNDITCTPLENQKENLKNKRRIGLGIMGYGSALLMMKIKYGSEKALKLTDKLMSFIANTAYQSSAKLAEEKGCFPLFDAEKYLKSNYIKNLSSETKELIKKFGTRNSHLLTIAPTGNSSSLANVVSGGLEPIFLFEYKRTAIQAYPPEGLNMPIINWETKTVSDNTNEWSWIKEGDENLLKCQFNNEIYKIDKNRGLTKESLVEDFAVKYLKSIGEWDNKSEWAANTSNLTLDEHINTMKVICKWIDSSCSKTINLPKDYSYEDFKDVYMKLYDSGIIKGGTTYREGTMMSVLSSIRDEKSIEKIIKSGNAPKRPAILPCDVMRFQNNKEKWIGFVGLLPPPKGTNNPYEVFTGLLDSFQVPTFVEKGWIKRVKKEGDAHARYDFLYIDKDGYEQEMRGLSRAFNKEYWNTGKMISAILRHGMPLPNAINLIDSLYLDGGDSIVSWKGGVKRMLKNYIKDTIISVNCPDCGEKLKIQEGCASCPSCGFSKCE